MIGKDIVLKRANLNPEKELPRTSSRSHGRSQACRRPTRTIAEEIGFYEQVTGG